MNLSDTQKRALALLALGPDLAPLDPAQRKTWGRLMGKLCALGYAERFDAPLIDEAYMLTGAGRKAHSLRVREALLMVCECNSRARGATEPAARQRWKASAQLWRNEYHLLGGAE